MSMGVFAVLHALALASTSENMIPQDSSSPPEEVQYSEYQEAFLKDARFIEETLENASSYSLCEIPADDPCAPKSDPIDFPIRNITDFASYSRALQVLVSAYNDPHIAYQSAGIGQWYLAESNGLSLVLRDGKWMVDYASDNLRRAGVSSGSELISCTAHSDLFRFRTMTEPLSAIASLPIVRADREGGDNCRFSTENGVKSVPIPEFPPSRDEILSALNKRVSGMQAQFAVAKIEGGLLIGLPNFRDRESWLEMQAFLASSKDALSNSRFVVVDLRGNAGGDSRIGDALISLLSSAPSSPPSSVRAYRTFLPVSAVTRSWLLRNSPALLPKLEEAQREGGGILELHDNRASSPTDSAGQSVFASPIFVVVDSSCISSCLMLLDWLTDDPAVTLMGHATSSDSKLGEIVSVNLPSGNGMLYFPLKLWPDRRRGPTAKYSPDLPADESVKFSIQGLIRGISCFEDIGKCLGSPHAEIDVLTPAPILIAASLSALEVSSDGKPFRAELELHFSTRMKKGSYSLVRGPSGVSPDCPSPPHMRDDGRTFVFNCRVESNRRYSIQLNSQRFVGFRAQDSEQILKPVSVHFSTE